MQSTLNDSETNEVWRQLAPLLEEAMGRLNEKERTVLALRLFDNKTAAETASLLGLRTDAAHKRTARALEKLRQFFLQRGISSSTALIAETISANSILAAPAPLAKSVVATAMVHGAAANSSTLILIKGALKIMAWSKAKTAIITAAILLLAAGAGTAMVKHVEMQRADSQRADSQRANAQRSRFQQRLVKIGPIMKISPDGQVSVVHLPVNGALPGRANGHGGGFVATTTTQAGRDEILRQLDQTHAVIVSNTPDLVIAESSKPPKMEIIYKFVDGEPTKVTMVHEPAPKLVGPGQ